MKLLGTFLIIAIAAVACSSASLQDNRDFINAMENQDYQRVGDDFGASAPIKFCSPRYCSRICHGRGYCAGSRCRCY